VLDSDGSVNWHWVSNTLAVRPAIHSLASLSASFSRIRYTLFTELMNRVEGGFRPASLRRNRLNLDVTELN